MSIEAYRWLMTAPQAPMVRETFQAAPQAGEVVVAVAGCGVCHTDLGYLYDGVRIRCPWRSATKSAAGWSMPAKARRAGSANR
jgi:mono/diheme cytochrome c family protein